MNQKCLPEIDALQLKEEGFALLLDDFGSRYSSLNILLETPFDVMKLDKKFMESMMVSGKGRLILEQVMTMADKLEPKGKRLKVAGIFHACYCIIHPNLKRNCIGFRGAYVLFKVAFGCQSYRSRHMAVCSILQLKPSHKTLHKL